MITIVLYMYTCSKPIRPGPNFTYLLKVPQLIHNAFSIKYSWTFEPTKRIGLYLLQFLSFLSLSIGLTIENLSLSGNSSSRDKKLGEWGRHPASLHGDKSTLIVGTPSERPVVEQPATSSTMTTVQMTAALCPYTETRILRVEFLKITTIPDVQKQHYAGCINLFSDTVFVCCITRQRFVCDHPIGNSILRYEARKTGNEATYGTLRCIMGICTAHLHSILYVSIKQRMKNSL